jgi:hypothetical protein
MRLAILAFGLALLAPAALAQAPSASGYLTRLHEVLRLTPAQEAAWKDYVRAVEPRAEAQARHLRAERLMPTLTTPRRIALISATMAADEADFRRQSVAVNAFYAQLTPRQQGTFDAETLPPANAQP